MQTPTESKALIVIEVLWWLGMESLHRAGTLMYHCHYYCTVVLWWLGMESLHL
jgi:hypothetical protein